jgi:hypothetical protein
MIITYANPKVEAECQLLLGRPEPFTKEHYRALARLHWFGHVDGIRQDYELTESGVRIARLVRKITPKSE